MEAVTHDDLLEALRAAMEEAPTEEGMTANEIAEHFGWCIKATRKRIGKLLKEGRAVCIPARRTRIDGQVQKVPAYRLS